MSTAFAQTLIGVLVACLFSVAVLLLTRTWTRLDRVEEVSGRVEVGLGEVRGDLHSLTYRVGKVEDGQAVLTTEVGELRGEVGELRGEVGELRGEVGELRGEVGELRVRVDGLGDQVGVLREQVRDVQDGQRDLVVGLKSLRDEIIERLDREAA